MSQVTITQRKVGKCLVLSMVTCGIYLWYWLYCTIKSIKELNNVEPTAFGEMLAIIFIPCYGAFWAFSRGKQLAIGAGKHGVELSDSSTVYMLFSAAGMTLVTLCLMQNELNAVAKQLEA